MSSLLLIAGLALVLAGGLVIVILVSVQRQRAAEITGLRTELLVLSRKLLAVNDRLDGVALRIYRRLDRVDPIPNRGVP